jgi:hypothetical protein
MALPSPACFVQDGSGPAVLASNMALLVTPGNTITISLVTSVGVSNWSIRQTFTDSLDLTSLYFSSGTTFYFSFQMPATGANLTLSSSVTDGNNNYLANVQIRSVPGVQTGLTGLSPIDPNSLIIGDLSSLDWQRVAPLSAPTVRSNDTAIFAPYLDGANVNPYADAPTGAFLGALVVAPPGATSMTFSIPVVAGTGGTVVLAAYDTTGTALQAKSVVTPTSAVAVASVTWPVVPGTEYQVQLLVNSPSLGTTIQANVFTGRASVTSFGSTGVWGSAFSRFHITPQSMQDNTQGYDATSRYYRTSAFARAVLDTTASQLGIEYTSTTFSLYPTLSDIFIQVNGRPYANVNPTVGGALQLATVSLSGALSRVELVNGLTYMPESAMLGNFIRAIYVPATAYAAFPVAA